MDNSGPHHHGVKACSWRGRSSTKLDMLDQGITFATKRSVLSLSLNVKQKEAIGTLIRGKETFCLLPTGFGFLPKNRIIISQNQIFMLS